MTDIADRKHDMQMHAVLTGVPVVRKLADGWNVTVIRRRGTPMVRVCSSWHEAMRGARSGQV